MDEKQEKQIEACRKLGMTDEEIKEMLDDDKAIDRSNLNSKVFDWELSKEDARKREIIQLLFDCLDENYGAVIDNPEKYIKFAIDGEEYTVSLIKHRKPKDE